MASYTFAVEKNCPICGKSTRVIKTRARLVKERTDEDFCVHYKDFNPYYYRVWICEHCGFAGDEKTFTSHMPDRDREKIKKFLDGKKISVAFTETRELPEAVASFKLAIFYLELIDASLSKRAGLYLGLAWVYRIAGDEEHEAETIKKAAELYDRSIMTEHYPIGGMTDLTVIYILGAIYYRIGDLDKSTQYLSRLIGNNEIRSTDPRLYDKARDLWADVRAMKSARQETKAEVPGEETGN